MKCQVCGGELEHALISLPFRVSSSAILVVKGLPVLECANCTEFILEDEVMAQVEMLVAKVDARAELEVVNYAA